MCYRGEQGKKGLDGANYVNPDKLLALVVEPVLSKHFSITYATCLVGEDKTKTAVDLVSTRNAAYGRSASLLVADVERISEVECACMPIAILEKHNSHYFEDIDLLVIDVSVELDDDIIHLICDRFKNTSYITIVV